VSIAAVSLFDAPSQPVLGAAGEWTRSVLGGSLATALCVIAIAVFGLMLLSGRLQVRRSVEVVGAGLLAEQFQRLSAGAAGTDQAGAEQFIIPAPPETPPMRRADYDPYAGASLRTD
jgi:type IV secretory pathway VirB2 component (pilin)